ncbi:deoxyribodipyrimidine photo-lyase [Anoxybacillus kestanbolensis]|uniref:deoxyribodipyrimidine photo-lyase n=1 Tax=Anoxybacillus kestanbolensis TaxID=227476 RepID=UPI0022A761F0|nr:deoxyribodipyrimidine photo-lyase [Anoxybacillus kestanbolensis]
MHTAVVWFRRDFRLHDHTALVHALHWAKERQGKLLFFFHFDSHSAKERTYHHEYFFKPLSNFGKCCVIYMGYMCTFCMEILTMCLFD